jgi:circadian clock protein KaiB
LSDPKPDVPAYHLRLFVAGSTPRAQRTIGNLQRLCAMHLSVVNLEIVDIYQQPWLAVQDQVIAAPTLVKLMPLPVRRIIGDLSDETRVLHALNLSLASNGR